MHNSEPHQTRSDEPGTHFDAVEHAMKQLERGRYSAARPVSRASEEEVLQARRLLGWSEESK